MAAKKKKAKKNKGQEKTANPNAEGAVDARLKHLGEARKVRRREPGDGDDVDIGIAPGAFSVSIERHLSSLKPENKDRLLKHMIEHVDAAMKPLRKLVKAKGSDHELMLLNDVGPNMLRTIIEFLEAKENK